VLEQIFFDASVKIATTLGRKPMANLIAMHASFVLIEKAIKFGDVNNVPFANVDLPPALKAFM
jgi:hypothetical protein